MDPPIDLIIGLLLSLWTHEIFFTKLLPMFITAFTVLDSWVGAHQGWGQLFEMHAVAVLCSCEASVCSCDCNCA